MVARATRKLAAAGLFERSLDMVARIGTEGYFVMVNHVRMGPEFIKSSYPREWQTEYDVNAYHLRDPAFLWSLTNNNMRRWSETKVPDAESVMKRARRHGLIFGAVFSSGTLARKSVLLSVGRDDRELSDEEMAAAHLNISPSAAKARLKTARDRFGVRTNTRIVAMALRSNLIA